ncbi:MAG TPA: hypothetical protein VKB41_17005, partial [Steroidobacteraceae bacterium]|nr:hypothetical protein [Steroidobacteraceae bacterium]
MFQPSSSFERLPPAVRTALQEIFGIAAADVELIERSWRVRWHRRAIATTRPNRIYLRGTITEFARDPALVLHEYFHVVHQWGTRRLTRWRYIAEWLKRGYFDNRFEVEAREFEAANQRRFRLLLARVAVPSAADLPDMATRVQGSR